MVRLSCCHDSQPSHRPGWLAPSIIINIILLLLLLLSNKFRTMETEIRKGKETMRKTKKVEN